jgi:predicted AAA+ superfamily ATPase
MVTMIDRWARPELEDALADTPVVLVHGPRQAGKSTLTQQVSEKLGGRTMVTLDDPEPYRLAKTHPAEFLHAYPAPVTIDEVQRAPELFLPIKAWIDRNRVPGSFLLTGSANVLMLPKLADSLAGRMEIVNLPPLAQGEIEGSTANFVDLLFAKDFNPRSFKADHTDLAARIVTGGYPEPVLRSPRRRAAWFQDYMRTLLDRDVRDIANIEGLTQVPRILSLLAARTGSSLNTASLSRDTGIAHTTLTRYLSLLKTIFLLSYVPAWSSDTGVSLAKTAKTYLPDTGLLCHLLRLEESDLGDRDRMGLVLENFVAVELSKLIDHATARPTLGHLRTVKLREVDFVLDAASKGVVGIEVSPTYTPSPTDAEGLRYLGELAGERFLRGIVLYLGNDVVPLGKDLWAVPVSALWAMT